MIAALLLVERAAVLAASIAVGYVLVRTALAVAEADRRH